MFLKSILEGFSMLRLWQIWVAVILYVGILFSFLISVGLFMEKDKGQFGKKTMFGCLTYMIGGTLLQAFLMSLLIFLLLPILLGGNKFMPFFMSKHLLLPLFFIGIIAFFIVTILSIMPLVGDFIGNSPSIQSFLEGVIIFRVLSVIFIEDYLTKKGVNINFNLIYPSFWGSLGFLIISGVLTWFLIIILAFIQTRFEYSRFGGEWIPIIFAPITSFLGGILPLLMYTSYVRLSLLELLM